jgi:hypothetical protein
MRTAAAGTNFMSFFRGWEKSALEKVKIDAADKATAVKTHISSRALRALVGDIMTVLPKAATFKTA